MTSEEEKEFLGTVRQSRIVPALRGRSPLFTPKRPLQADEPYNFQEGDVVVCKECPVSSKRHGLVTSDIPVAEIIRKVDHLRSDADLWRIVARANEIRIEVPREAFRDAQSLPSPPSQCAAEDSHFLTIAPEGSRQLDLAVYAARDPSPKNPRGHIIRAAIADVARYVCPGTILDKTAREVGCTRYFPNHVLPMLPPRLVEKLCCLKEGETRSAIVAEMNINKNGKLLKTRFCRIPIRVRKKLSYEECEAKRHKDFLLKPLFAAYKALEAQQASRGPLKIVAADQDFSFNQEGRVEKTWIRPVLDSQRMMESFVVLANRAAAMQLLKTGIPFMQRNHPAPSMEKIQVLCEALTELRLVDPNERDLHKKLRHPAALNRLVEKARQTGQGNAVCEQILQAQGKAFYSVHGEGHFELQLKEYTRFTSPVSRYADIVVQRALIAALRLGEKGGHIEEKEELETLASHLNEQENLTRRVEQEAIRSCMVSLLGARKTKFLKAMLVKKEPGNLFFQIEKTTTQGSVPFDDQSRLASEIKIGTRAILQIERMEPTNGSLRLKLHKLLDEQNQSGKKKKRKKAASRRSPP